MSEAVTDQGAGLVGTGPVRLHHVVFCVHPENQERAAGLWRQLGLTFAEVDLDDLGLRVLIDWDAGIEVVSPVGDGEQSASFTAFLSERGEGLYSVVMGVDEVAGPVALAARYGAVVEYEQHRRHGALTIDEVSLAPFCGMAVTFLATDPPL
jgi:hypothetical protein